MAFKMIKAQGEPIVATVVAEKPVDSVIIWIEAGVRFFVHHGDVSHLHQKFMDGKCTELESEEIHDLVMDSKGKRKPDVTMTNTFPSLAVINGAKVVVTGYLP